jgi:hypothetical protein
MPSTSTNPITQPSNPKKVHKSSYLRSQLRSSPIVPYLHLTVKAAGANFSPTKPTSALLRPHHLARHLSHYSCPHPTTDAASPWVFNRSHRIYTDVGHTDGNGREFWNHDSLSRRSLHDAKLSVSAIGMVSSHQRCGHILINARGPLLLSPHYCHGLKSSPRPTVTKERRPQESLPAQYKRKR